MKPDLDLDALDRLEKEATPGPWQDGDLDRWVGGEWDRVLLGPGPQMAVLALLPTGETEREDATENSIQAANLRLIVEMRNVLPDLLAVLSAQEARIRELEAELAASRAALQKYGTHGDCAMWVDDPEDDHGFRLDESKPCTCGLRAALAAPDGAA